MLRNLLRIEPGPHLYMGNPYIDRIRRHIFGYHSTRTNHTSSSNGNTLQDDCTGPNPASRLNDNILIQVRIIFIDIGQFRNMFPHNIRGMITRVNHYMGTKNHMIVNVYLSPGRYKPRALSHNYMGSH